MNTKSQTLHEKFFFRKIHFLAQKQVNSQKGIKFFQPQIFVFVSEKNAYYAIFIY